LGAGAAVWVWVDLPHAVSAASSSKAVAREAPAFSRVTENPLWKM
jgi:hypothetical protein